MKVEISQVERVARAIFLADNNPGVTWDDDAKEWERDDYRKMARAAIDAHYAPDNVE